MKRLLLITLSVFAATLTAHAGPISLTLNPADGVLTGSPGSTVAWAFTLMGDDNYYLTVNAVTLDTDPNPGNSVSDFSISDFHDVFSGTVTDALAPGGSITNEILATFDIPLGAGGQSTPELTITVDYELDNADPFFDTPTITQFGSVSATGIVEAESSTPEPGAWSMIAAGLALTMWAGRRMRSASPKASARRVK